LSPASTITTILTTYRNFLSRIAYRCNMSFLPGSELVEQVSLDDSPAAPLANTAYCRGILWRCQTGYTIRAILLLMNLGKDAAEIRKQAKVIFTECTIIQSG